MQVNELLFDDAHFSHLMYDQTSLFTQMEVVDLMYHQFFFTVNCLGCQPTKSQFFQLLAPQTLALAAAAIHLALPKDATGKYDMVMMSQEECRGTGCFLPVIDCTLEATAPVNDRLVACTIPSHRTTALLG